MFRSQTLALIASAAVAQKGWYLVPMNVGGDRDSDGAVVNAAGSCMGADGFASGDEFFVGVAEVEGLNANYLVGWGKGFCTEDMADADADYTISLTWTDGDGASQSSDTGLTITCPADKKAATTTWKNLEAQVDDKKAMKALKGVKQEVLKSETVLIDSLMAKQTGVRTDTTDLLDGMVVDGQAFLDDLQTTSDEWIDAMIEEITVTKDSEYDAYIVQVTTEIYDAIILQVEETLTTDEIAIIEDQGKEALVAVLGVFSTSFDTIKESMYTSLSTLGGTGKDDITEIIDELKDSWTSETAKIQTIVDNTAVLEQSTLDKKIVPKMERLQKKLDNKLNKVVNGTKKVSQQFVKETKAAIDAEVPGAEEDVAAAIEGAVNVLSPLMDDNPSGQKKVLAAVYQTEKMVKSASKQVIKDIQGYSKAIAKQMNEDMKGEVKTRKTDSKTYIDGKYVEADALFNDVSPYPKSDDTAFSYNDLSTASISVTAVITKSSDSTTASCVLVAQADPRTDSCEYSAIDNMKYEYLCNMTAQDIKVQGVTVDCSDDFRPAAVWC